MPWCNHRTQKSNNECPRQAVCMMRDVTNGERYWTCEIHMRRLLRPGRNGLAKWVVMTDRDRRIFDQRCVDDAAERGVMLWLSTNSHIASSPSRATFMYPEEWLPAWEKMTMIEAERVALRLGNIARIDGGHPFLIYDPVVANDDPEVIKLHMRNTGDDKIMLMLARFAVDVKRAIEALRREEYYGNGFHRNKEATWLANQ